ncbi:MAG: YciI family protein [Rhodocyclaceae bacterium]|nr:YciI family protein [Rhodocyclaceae bacterium]
MIYALIGEDRPDSLEARKAVRSEHLARLNELKDQGRLLMAGPFPAIDSPDPGPAGFTGSLVVAEFPSLADAEAWLAEDPYTRTGVFVRTQVRPYKKVLP